MPKRLLGLVCFLLIAASGDSPVRLDMSSEETYRESLHAMKAQMPDEQQTRLDLALGMIRAMVMLEMDQSALSAALRRDSHSRTTLFGAFKKKLHGKTAQQLLSLAPSRLAESDLRNVLEESRDTWARQADILSDARIAEKRASIEATDDPLLKERKRRELQSLLKMRDDLTNRESKSDGDRFLSGSYRPPGEPLSTRPVAINIGDPGYVIPRNFVSRIAWKGSKDNHQHVVLQALWPGMEPRTKENERLWRYYDDVGVRVADWNAEREIRMILAPSGYLASDGFKRFQNAFRNTDPNPGQQRYGLTPYPQRRGRFRSIYHVAESTAYRSPQNTPLVFKCEEATEGIMELFPVKIRCETSYVLEDGVGLYYHFYAESLKGWKERDIAVRHFVTSLRSTR